MTSDPSCIFCKIVAGEIPCYKLAENDAALAFLDIGPLSQGHCLIIPRNHHATLDAMPDALIAECAVMVARLSRAIKAATATDGWNVLQNNGRVSGQEVDHVHFHIIPRRDGDGLGYRWQPGQLGADEATPLLAAIQSKL